MLQALELGIVDLNCSHKLAIKESKRVYFRIYLLQLLSYQAECHFVEGHSLERFRLNLESLTL